MLKVCCCLSENCKFFPLILTELLKPRTPLKVSLNATYLLCDGLTENAGHENAEHEIGEHFMYFHVHV